MECQQYWQCQRNQSVQCVSQPSDCEIKRQKNSFAVSKDSVSIKSQGAENLAPSKTDGAEPHCRDDEFIGTNDTNDTHLINPTDFSSLLDSMEKCKKGVLFKVSASRFYLHGIESCIKLERQLKDGTYKESEPYKFTVTYPKKREIVSITFRDRVYQRSLNDNAIYSQMTKPFIYHNFACQKGKGTDKTRDSFVYYLRKHYRKYGLQGGVLKFDIKGYYNNLSKQTVLDTFRKHLDLISYQRAEKVLLHQYKNIKGFNPGSQMVQIAGVSVLNILDHYIKEELRVGSYLRYMDDGLIIHPSVEFLEDCKLKIESFLNTNLGLSLHPTKSKVYDLSKDSIEFLGFYFKLSNQGKVLKRINPQNVKHQKRRLTKLVHLAFKGLITRSKVEECYTVWKSHAQKSNCCFRLLKRMDLYYNNLWRKESYGIY